MSSLVGKQCTNLTGLASYPNPKAVIFRIYKRITKLLNRMPEEAFYRKATEDIIKKRTAILNSTDDPKIVAEKIGCGVIEEVILEARQELEVTENFIMSRPWESLVSQPPKNQWRWPVK